MLITRKAEFSASHICRNPAFSEDENRAAFGAAANPHGHGHNYVLEVTLAGEPDRVTGMVMDLKELKEILNREVVQPFDHRFLNHEVAPFDRVIPTVENIAVEIWTRLAPHFTGERGTLHSVRLYETPDLWVDYFGEARMIDVTRLYRFSASHRLHTPQLSAEANRDLYGKCNNPYGHGHNYEVAITVRGPVDETTGRAVDPLLLDRMVRSQVLDAFDHRNLNAEIAQFSEVVPTSENLALEVDRRLRAAWPGVFPGAWPRLEKIRIAETERNIFEVSEGS